MVKALLLAACVGMAATVTAAAEPQTPAVEDVRLGQAIDLGGERSVQTQYFVMESQTVAYGPDGARLKTDIYRLRLKCVPARLAGTEGDQYTCLGFTLQQDTGPQVACPALTNWTYVFKPGATGKDGTGPMFGIDHPRFENLTDANGLALPPDKAYQVYNAFIDFHSFNDVFGAKAAGHGIQELKQIGQKIVHAAALSEAPVNVGSNVAPGSVFKNGQITLELKGLSVVQGRPCALVGYDSGASSFRMTIKPMPNLEVQSVGGSHYKGDIYKDLKTNWMLKATLEELVVSEVRLPMPPNKINAIAERSIVVRNVPEQELPK